MFNCPQWGIGVQSIRVLGGTDKTTLVTHTSCDSLVRVCMATDTDPFGTHTLVLNPLIDNNSSLVYLAEVTFYDRECQCLPNAILNQHPQPSLTQTGSGASKTLNLFLSCILHAYIVTLCDHKICNSSQTRGLSSLAWPCPLSDYVEESLVAGPPFSVPTT